jgi:hypothetical protein
MFEKKVLKRIFWPERDEGTIYEMAKSRITRQARHVTCFDI